jgi:hypothetical protein
MEQEKTDSLLTEEYLKEIHEDLKINEFDLKSTCLTLGNRTQRYIEEYYRCSRKLRKLERYAKKVEGELFEKYKFNFRLSLSSSVDVMKFVNKDPKYFNACSARDEYAEVVEFLAQTIKNMQNVSWNIQRIIEAEKLQ